MSYSFIIAKEPRIWLANDYSLHLKGELTMYIDNLYNRIKADYKADAGTLETFYNFGTDSKYYTSSDSGLQIKTGDLIILFSGLTINCEQKTYIILIDYFVIDGCNLWAWISYDNTIFHSEQPEALNSIYDILNKRIKVYLNQNKLNEK